MAKKSYITEKIQTLTNIDEIYKYLNSLKRDLSEIIKVLRFNNFDFVDDYLYKRKNFKICRCCFEFIKEPCDKPECLKFYESKKLKTREAIIEGNKKRDYKKEVEKRRITISQDPDYYNEVVSKRAETNLERYGDSKYNNAEAIKKAHCNLDYKAIDLKRRQTNNERYGYDYTFEMPEHRERIKATNKERYGYENPMQNPDIKAKAKATNKEKYGYENPMQCPEIQAKAKATNKERYGYDWIFQSPEYQESFKLIYILDHLNLPRNFPEDLLFELYPEYINFNIKHKHLKNYKDYNEEFIKNNFIENGYFLKIKFQEYFGLNETTVTNSKSKFNIDVPTLRKFGESEAKFLDFVESIYNLKLIRQFLIPGTKYKVDGYVETNQELTINSINIDPGDKLVFEYLGNFWHGYSNDSKLLFIGATPKQLYDRTFERLNFIAKLGYKVFYIWESESNSIENLKHIIL